MKKECYFVNLEYMMTKTQRVIKVVFIFAISLLLICLTLYSGENVTMRNNGDFNRITRLCSLEQTEAGGYTIVLEGGSLSGNLYNLLFTPEDVSTYPSSQLGFVRVSVATSYLWNVVSGGEANRYHPACLSLLYAVLYAVALTFTLLRFPIRNKYCYWAFAAVFLIGMCDIGYVSYFSSFYAEGLQHILLVLLVGFLLQGGRKPFAVWETICFALTLIWFGTAKFFNIPLAVGMALLSVLLLFRNAVCKRAFWVHLSAVLLSCVVLFQTYSSLPLWISKETNYNSVFFGIVKDCDDQTAKGYLEELDLSPDLYELKNTHHYVSNFSHLKNTYPLSQAEEIKKTKLLSFYFTHPGLSFRKVGEIAAHSSHIRNIFFLEESFLRSGFRCTLWSSLREHVGFDTVVLNGLVILLVLLLLWYVFHKSGTKQYLTILFLAVLAGMFVYTFFIPYVSNGEADLAKHMYLFVELIDLSLLGILAVGFSLPKLGKRSLLALLLLTVVFNLIPQKTPDTVSFGGYQWYVIEETKDYKALLAKEAVDYLPYDSEKNNCYGESSVHKWLNETFLARFSQSERERLLKKEEKVALSSAHLLASEGGNRDFYCSAFPKRVNHGGDEAYYETVSGMVFLPGAKQIEQMANIGYPVTLGEKYWLATPYFSHGEKSRYVHPDGLVYFSDTDEPLGIRPLIYLKKEPS